MATADGDIDSAMEDGKRCQGFLGNLADSGEMMADLTGQGHRSGGAFQSQSDGAGGFEFVFVPGFDALVNQEWGDGRRADCTDSQGAGHEGAQVGGGFSQFGCCRPVGCFDHFVEVLAALVGSQLSFGQFDNFALGYLKSFTATQLNDFSLGQFQSFDTTGLGVEEVVSHFLHRFGGQSGTGGNVYQSGVGLMMALVGLVVDRVMTERRDHGDIVAR